MQYRGFRDTGINFSLLGLGCMRFPRKEGELIDYDKAEKIVDYAYANGINYYDTAYVYNSGDSERVIGKALSKYPRDSFMLASKMPGFKCKCEQDVYDIFNEQLERCGVEYFDFYLCHNINTQSYDNFDNDYMLKALANIKAEGKIRRLGFSSHAAPEMLARFADLQYWDFAQIQLNYLDWTYQDAKRQYEILTERGIPIIVMEPVRGGRLASLGSELDGWFKDFAPDRSVASWAIRWAASHKNVLCVLSGMSDMEQIEDNIATISDFEPITPAEQELLDKATGVFLSKNQVPCTGCRYCIDCPIGIDIPAMMKIYNEYSLSKVFFDLFGIREHPEGQRPEDCISCRACVQMCPQNIEIPEIMEYLATEAQKSPQ